MDTNEGLFSQNSIRNTEGPWRPTPSMGHRCSCPAENPSKLFPWLLSVSPEGLEHLEQVRWGGIHSLHVSPGAEEVCGAVFNSWRRKWNRREGTHEADYHLGTAGPDELLKGKVLG